MKAGGISLFGASVAHRRRCRSRRFVSLFLQEELVPLANDQAAYLREVVIKHLSLVGSNLTVVTALPGGGKQVTIAGAIEPSTQTLLNVTVLRTIASRGRKRSIFSRARGLRRADLDASSNATTYHFESDGDVSETIDPDAAKSTSASARDSSAQRTAQANDPEEPLAARRSVRCSTPRRLARSQRRLYAATYAAKLARPFAALVFASDRVSARDAAVRGGGASWVSALALAIVFVYYVIATIVLSVGSLAYGRSPGLPHGRRTRSSA